MSEPNPEIFKRYKVVEQKALEILKEMKTVTKDVVDIELALVVAIFELHKGQIEPARITKIVQSHCFEIQNFYAGLVGDNPVN